VRNWRNRNWAVCVTCGEGQFLRPANAKVHDCPKCGGKWFRPYDLAEAEYFGAGPAVVCELHPADPPELDEDDFAAFYES
jgi:hypothetical protein